MESYLWTLAIFYVFVQQDMNHIDKITENYFPAERYSIL